MSSCSQEHIPTRIDETIVRLCWDVFVLGSHGAIQHKTLFQKKRGRRVERPPEEHMTLAEAICALHIMINDGCDRLHTAKAPPVNGPMIPPVDDLLGHPEKLSVVVDAVIAFGSRVDDLVKAARWRTNRIADQQALRQEAVASGVNPGGWISIPQDATHEQREAAEQRLNELRTRIEAAKARSAENLIFAARKKALCERFVSTSGALGRRTVLPDELANPLATSEDLDQVEHLVKNLEQDLAKHEAGREAARRTKIELEVLRKQLLERRFNLPSELKETVDPHLLRMGAGWDDLNRAEEEITLLEREAAQFKQPSTATPLTAGSPKTPKGAARAARRAAKRARKAGTLTTPEAAGGESTQTDNGNHDVSGEFAAAG